MKALVLITAIVFCFSCSSPEGEFSNDFIYDWTGYLEIPQKSEIISAAFDSDDSFWLSDVSEERILTKTNLDGYEENFLRLYIYPAASNIDHLDFAADGATLFFTMYRDGMEYNEICRINLYNGNYEAFTLDGTDNRIIPNSDAAVIDAASYAENDTLVYLATKYDDPSMRAYQSLNFFDLATDTLTSYSLNPAGIPYDSGRNLENGKFFLLDTYIRPDSGETGDTVICREIEKTDSLVHGFRMYNSAGELNFDSEGVFEFQEISGVRWMDEETIMFSGRIDDEWEIFSGNSSGNVISFFEADDGVMRLEGLEFSPSKKQVMTKAYYHDGSMSLIVIDITD